MKARFPAVVRAEIVRREYSIMINLRQQVAKRLDDQSIAALRVQSGNLLCYNFCCLIMILYLLYI